MKRVFQAKRQRLCWVIILSTTAVKTVAFTDHKCRYSNDCMYETRVVTLKRADITNAQPILLESNICLKFSKKSLNPGDTVQVKVLNTAYTPCDPYTGPLNFKSSLRDVKKSSRWPVLYFPLLLTTPPPSVAVFTKITHCRYGTAIDCYGDAVRRLAPNYYYITW